MLDELLQTYVVFRVCITLLPFAALGAVYVYSKWQERAGRKMTLREARMKFCPDIPRPPMPPLKPEPLEMPREESRCRCCQYCSLRRLVPDDYKGTPI